jgi:uncharacterized membrane protein
MYHWGFFNPFGFLFFLLIIGLVIANIRMWRGRAGVCFRGLHYDSQFILDKRLASGEIDIEEYQKLKEVLIEKKK